MQNSPNFVISAIGATSFESMLQLIALASKGQICFQLDFKDIFVCMTVMAPPTDPNMAEELSKALKLSHLPDLELFRSSQRLE